jgi:hypothetical protein
VNSLSGADQSKLLPLLHRCPEEARIPNQRNRDASSVDQVHNQSLVSQLGSDGPQRRFIDYQSSHSTLSGTFVHFLQQSFGCPGVPICRNCGFSPGPPDKEEVPVSRSGSIVDAFPNGFLGVLMPEEELLSAPRLKRRRRFDWLYERLVASGRLESVLSKNLELPQEVWRRLSSETDHELRAALICLLTAALAAQGAAAIIGEPNGGWFWLPPWSLWRGWAIGMMFDLSPIWPEIVSAIITTIRPWSLLPDAVFPPERLPAAKVTLTITPRPPANIRRLRTLSSVA